MKTDSILDYVIIGSGFGGSVSAMRLAEKGYAVAVLEKGKRYNDKDFPKTNRSMSKYMWAPALGWYGPQNMSFYKNAFVLSGIGVGGGSLIYANTHMIPSDDFFENPVWSSFRDWKKTLMPFYDTAKFMLGTVPVTKFCNEDMRLKEIAADLGKEETFSGVNVGVYFGDKEVETDPYFGGKGPMRKGCRDCAGCMIGCRYNAKNTLDKNYLWFAEKFGVKIYAETIATKIEFDGEKYTVHTKRSTGGFNRDKKTFTAKGLIISGGVLGSLKLLFEQKYHYKTLPALSDKLGKNILTNSKSICGVTLAKEKLNNGVAITSIFAPDKHTHIEIVKYSDRADAMKMFATPLTGKGNGVPRGLKAIGNIIAHPWSFLRMLFNKDWANNSILIMVMQTTESFMEIKYKKGLFRGMSFSNAGNKKVPSYNEIAQDITRRYAEKVGGIPANSITEVLFGMSTADHILGGCPMGKTIDEAVVNDRFEVYGYPNMYVLDGSVMPCNLGVNPSLTITALCEYAMSLIPEKEGNTNRSIERQMKEGV